MSFRLKADYDEMVKKNQELESKLLQMVVLGFPPLPSYIYKLNSNIMRFHCFVYASQGVFKLLCPPKLKGCILVRLLLILFVRETLCDVYITC